MVVLIAGASHTGKTALAQRLLEKYKFPYFSIDHLKMGLIRSGNTALTPESSDGELTAYLWPIVREMIKTAVENRQNLIVEGCYIPFDWQNSFDREYLREIRYFCLVMTESYIRENFDNIKGYAGVIEDRLDGPDFTLEHVLDDNAYHWEMCRKHGHTPVLIDKSYRVAVELEETASSEKGND